MMASRLQSCSGAWSVKFRGPKWATTRSKRAQTTRFNVSRGLGSFLKKKKKQSFFLSPLDPLTSFGTHLFGLVACRSLWGTSLGVCLGDFEGVETALGFPAVLTAPFSRVQTRVETRRSVGRT